MEGGDEVEQGKCASFTQGIEDLVDAGDGELSEGADGIQLLIIYGDADASILLGDGYHGAGIRRSRMLDETGGKRLVDDSIGFLGQDRVHPVGA